MNSIVSDLDESEDITQKVFGNLMTAIQKYEPRQVPFAAWILRVARNAALDHLIARDDAQLRQVLLCLQDRRLPLPSSISSQQDEEDVRRTPRVEIAADCSVDNPGGK